MNEPIRVALPLGIGDAHWSCQKLRGIKALHPDRPLHAHINESTNHKTVGYLEMFPFIDAAHLDKRAPYCITQEMPGTYKDPRYGTLEGCRGWRGFDYVLVANHWVEQGVPIADWIPEVETQYDFEYQMDAAAPKSHELMPEPTVLLYLSGVGPNQGFHRDWWTVMHWVEVIRYLNSEGIRPLLVGAPTRDDLGYMERLFRIPTARRASFDNAIGKTTIPEYVHLISRCSCWCGLNSGGGIVSASARTPTVMFWADNRWPVGGAHFKPGMQTAWLSEEQLDTYRTVSYGDPRTTPERVVEKILEVRR